MLFKSEENKTAKTICHPRTGNFSHNPAAWDYVLVNYQVCEKILRKKVGLICRRTKNHKNDQLNILTPKIFPPLI